MLTFTKMHGLGNDYIYVECFNQQVPDPSALAVAMADRHFGIGGDGLILLLPPDDPARADLRMRMFNADGSESQMCGNGIRCVCKLAHDRGLADAHPMRIETGAGVLSLEYELDTGGLVRTVTVDMGPPILDPALIPVELPRPHRGPIVDYPLEKCIPIGPPAGWIQDCGIDQRMTCISMGNPHVVIFCTHVDSVPLERLGPFIERQNIFPQRINVHFAQVVDRQHVIMRTWERGTGITLACGTGACAVCVAGVLTDRTDRVISAQLPGGALNLRWDEQMNHVFKTGPATEVFTGTWPHPLPATHGDAQQTSAAHFPVTAR